MNIDIASILETGKSQPVSGRAASNSNDSSFSEVFSNQEQLPDGGEEPARIAIGEPGNDQEHAQSDAPEDSAMPHDAPEAEIIDDSTEGVLAVFATPQVETLAKQADAPDSQRRAKTSPAGSIFEMAARSNLGLNKPSDNRTVDGRSEKVVDGRSDKVMTEHPVQLAGMPGQRVGILGRDRDVDIAASTENAPKGAKPPEGQIGVSGSPLGQSVTDQRSASAVSGANKRAVVAQSTIVGLQAGQVSASGDGTQDASEDVRINTPLPVAGSPAQVLEKGITGQQLEKLGLTPGSFGKLSDKGEVALPEEGADGDDSELSLEPTHGRRYDARTNIANSGLPEAGQNGANSGSPAGSGLASANLQAALNQGGPGADGAFGTSDLSSELSEFQTQAVTADNRFATTSAQLQTPSTLSRQDPSVILKQVADGIQKMSEGRIELRLSPEELGSVRMQFVQGENGLTVNIQAERSETLDLIRRNIEELARDLAQGGFEAAGFTFGEEGAEGSGPDRQSDGQEPTVEEAQTDKPMATAQRDGLDIRI